MNLKVDLVYRNYKPLHDLYASLRDTPPPGISYSFPEVKKWLRNFYPFYLKYGDSWLVRKLIALLQEILFKPSAGTRPSDLLHFLQFLPRVLPAQPFVVDFEHIIGLANFVTLDSKVTVAVVDTLQSYQCRKIMPLSQAASRSLERLCDGQPDIMEKVEVVYPALADYSGLHAVPLKYVDPDPRLFNLLFVGNSPFKKGLPELLRAFRKLEDRYEYLRLYVISDLSHELQRQYLSEKINFFKPVFNSAEIVEQFFHPCDLFVLPTHDDTFGMALLYALSCNTPVLTTRQFAAEEIVTAGYNGMFVESERLHLNDVAFPDRSSTNRYHKYDEPEALLVEDLVKKIALLYEDRKFFEDLREHAGDEFKPGGKFSVAVRNKKLARIYSEAIKYCPATSSGKIL